MGIAALGLVAAPQYTSAQNASPSFAGLKRADFGREQASPDVRHIAHWITDSSDNRNLPFAIIDKTKARIFVFNSRGRIRGAAPVLLGSAHGDDSVPGIGEREISDIRPHERTTPAGRFVAERGRNLNGKDIIWIDYDAAVSMHRVRAGNPRDRRLERLATATSTDNRISYGCINVSATFYNTVIDRAFSTKGIVYILPELRPVREVFGSYDDDARVKRKPGGSQERATTANER